MKKISIFPLVLMIPIIFLLGCSDSSFQAQVGETVDIKYGNSVYISDAGLTISFDGDVFDSRCPMNAYCIWPGQAEVEFMIQKEGEDAVISTAILNAVDKPAKYPGYEIHMLWLEPYPVAPVDIDNSSRIVTIRVNESDAGNEPGIDTVHFSEMPPSDLMVDAFELKDASINGDILTLTVSYSGGCKDHDFTLYMAPPAFMESYPVQANIYLEHQAYNDMCEAYITEDLQFNLRPIAEKYFLEYDQYDDINLNIFEYFEDQPSEFIRITYSPR
ncbi:MAG: hypothetical protein GWO41_13230 [candidate division Zixibacteria bacterium]|nr:hypothetical protein [candidate division Zixibacteria bacterium]NIR66198.1 hypothetical protein [candidate division Zixibacteria bacterium]NIS17302.1 hypothetical protein [candidate division Zixibacteria bacterium]NIS47820.1 hypothetical protein [candidate division Zixibacteria bacterium]NIT53662.1 hypothetical protein [candidate division Zixibacteria bacterium]